MTEVTRCGLCGGDRISPILDMGAQPLAEDYRAEPPRYPLLLLECADCTLVQLSHVVDQRELFPLDHPYTTATSPALKNHYMQLASAIAGAAGLRVGDLVTDIGANDGTLLKAMDGHGLNLLAVEPTNQIHKLADTDIIRCQGYFTTELARQIRAQRGPAKVITACNVLAHVPDPHDFINGVEVLLAKGGVFVTENHDVAQVLGGQFDAVYHEHLRYWSVATLSRLLSAHGLNVIRAEPTGQHGGSFRTWARRHRYGLLEATAHETANKLWCLLEKHTGRGEHLAYGIGATTRASGLIHFAGIADFLAAVAEVPGSEKIGHVMPGTSIPIVDEARLLAGSPPPCAVLFSWHLADVIIPKLRERGFEGKIIIPFPEPRLAE